MCKCGRKCGRARGAHHLNAKKQDEVESDGEINNEANSIDRPISNHDRELQSKRHASEEDDKDGTYATRQSQPNHTRWSL